MATSTIHDILAQFRDEELHNRHLGDRFERLICRYLELDPLFADRFSNVMMWNDLSKFSLKNKKNLRPHPRAVQRRKQPAQRR